MPKKVSVKKCAADFRANNAAIIEFAQQSRSLSDQHQTWCYDQAIIMLYKEFEDLVFEALVGAINNDTANTISSVQDLDLPKHLSRSVCEYLVIQDGYFDFKGRSGLIKILKKYLPDAHYLVQCVRDDRYKETIEKLFVLRNFASHNSSQSKKAVLKVLNQQRIKSSGAWVKVQGRLQAIIDDLNDLAEEIENGAPY